MRFPRAAATHPAVDHDANVRVLVRAQNSDVRCSRMNDI